MYWFHEMKQIILVGFDKYWFENVMDHPIMKSIRFNGGRGEGGDF